MKITIQVSATADLKDLYEKEVECEPVGSRFVVHLTPSPEEPCWEGQPWTVTHRASKLAVGDRYPSKHVAMQAAIALDALPYPWDDVECHEDTHIWPLEWRREVGLIVCRFGGHEHSVQESESL